MAVEVGYGLGVDLGTTYTSAAIIRSGEITMAILGEGSPEMPSVVAMAADQLSTDQMKGTEMLVGASAKRRTMVAPTFGAREFKRRIGDPVPIIIGEVPFSPESLMTTVLRTVIDRVTLAEGEPPSDLAVTFPAGWGAYKLQRLNEVVTDAGWPNARRLSEPEAAARHYLERQQLDSGATIAVFDFGGGTFDAAVLRHTGGNEFQLAGEAMGLERLGGVDLDEAVFQYVVAQVDINLADVGQSPAAAQAVARLRADCVAAKEALSSDTSTTIPVMLPDCHTEIRLTRLEFETMIRPAIADAIGVIDETVTGASLEPDELDAVLLIGGSSRIPLVSQMVGTHFGLPTLVDAHPKHTIASGAAMATQRTMDSPEASPEGLGLDMVQQSHEASNPGPSPSTSSQQGPTQSAQAETSSVLAGGTKLEDEQGPSATSEDGEAAVLPRGRALFTLTLLALVGVISIGFVAASLRSSDDDESGSTDTAFDSSKQNDPALLPEPEFSSRPASQPVTDFSDIVGPHALSETADRFAFHNVDLYAADGPASAPNLLWTGDGFGLGDHHVPVMGGNGLVFTFEEQDDVHNLVALDGASGERVWSAPAPWASTLFTAGSAVMVTSFEGVEAFDQQSGEWLGFIGPRVDDSPGPSHVRGNRAILSSTRDGADGLVSLVRVIDLATNEVIWQREEDFGTASHLTAFVADDTTLITGTSRELVARDIESGDELWRTEAFGSRDLNLLAAGVVVGTVDGNLIGTDARSGEELWRRIGRNLFESAADDSLIFTMNRAGELEAISLTTGTTAWAVKPSPRPSPNIAVVIGKDQVYVIQAGGSVTAHRTDTGEIVWLGEMNGLFGSDKASLVAAVVDERLLIAKEGRIYVLGVGEPANESTPDDTVTNEVVSPLGSILGEATVLPTALSSFQSGGEPFIEPGPGEAPTLLWTINRSLTQVPAVAAGGLVLYVEMRVAEGTTEPTGYVVAAEASTGVEQWATGVGPHVFRLYTTHTVVLAHTFNGLVSLDLITGDKLGSAAIPTPAAGYGPVIHDGSLIVGSSGLSSSGAPNFVDSINILSGKTNWTFEDTTEARLPTHFFVGDDSVVIVLENSTIGIDLATGKERWRSTEFASSEVILMRGERLLVRLDFDNFAVLDAATGIQQWSGGVAGFGVRDDGESYYAFPVGSHQLVKVNLADGAEVWRVATPSDSIRLTLISDAIVYLVDSDGRIAAHSASDGRLLWSIESSLGLATGSKGAVGSNVLVVSAGTAISVFG